ncbi:hypothetical protein ASC94_08305 [Massilia sp. Root418]|jgi:hypothetical protein|uniref:hypothetical protein n=1 Tax=Massilia sp. Root418 TaxID=1736532 RepID=UPI0006F220F3|nr:hypothetical protein [Massilia sp. Root418]KQW96817.1 hypothetical protein ASC94_08305 [Massilia sp. Root418]
MLVTTYCRLAAGLAAALAALPAAASPPAPCSASCAAAAPDAAPAAVAALPARAPAAPGTPRKAGFAAAVQQDDGRLEQLRGGADTVWNDMKLSGTVGANTALNVVTGANLISDGAFANAAGLPTVIQNSGANVLIQNATIVNVQFR